jgi:cytochrome c553
MTFRQLSVATVLTLLTTSPSLFATDADAGVTFFESKIRPVLVEQCYQCHAAEKQRGGLRLDSRDALRKGGDSGPVLVPGKPSESLLIKAIRHQEPKMPPKSKLADAVVADFVKWVEIGAPDPRDTATTTVAAIDFAKARQFWSFQPPHLSEMPKVQNAAWPKNGIDHFILARLEAEKLQPVALADKRSLIRRATFDLIGLPPTPEEVDGFLKDESPDAFAKVVDRLLASPHYGERWGRHWLDVARYAEDQAHTFGVKPSTNAYRYRDWVIAALNEDMPYDRFVKLQLAADLLLTDDAERVKHLPALGFMGLGAQYYKDNSEILKALADELDERVDTLSRGLLGLTLACARCHDHKFDPIPTQDYYSIAGIFNSCKLTDLPLASRADVEQYQEGVKLARAAEDKLKTFVRIEKTACQSDQAGEIARYMQAVRKMQERRQKEPKWSVQNQAKEDGLHVAALDRWMKYLDKAPNVMALSAWRNLPKPTEPERNDADVLAAAQAFQEHVQSLLTERAKGKLDKEKTALLDALFGEKGPFNLSDDELKSRLPADKKQQMEQMQQDAAKLRKEAPDKMEARFAISHGMGEGTPADMKVYIRGNPRTQGDAAPRRFLRILANDTPPSFTKGSGRLELAEAIASKDNPLTARVIVNRVWAWHFGRGIVGTPSNFGSLGERPTHPELLDYLTCRFVASGWSFKALHRDIVLSATYQLSSADSEHNRGIDGDNRFLWRMNRRRLDVESWRDALLTVSGQLDRTLGGSTIDLNAGANRRRTVYGKISRHELNGLLRLFDFPDANITSEKRTETTVPQQQLFVLNSAFVVEQAKALAARVHKEGQDDGERIRRACALAYGRSATDAEVELVQGYLSIQDSDADKPKAKLTRWERFAQALLGSNEFMYVD